MIGSSAKAIEQLNNRRNELADNLNEMGVAADREEKLDSLVPKVLEIEGGYTPPLPYGLVDLPDELLAGTLYAFLSSKGEMLFSTSTPNAGLWRLDKDDNTVKKIFDPAYRIIGYWESGTGLIFMHNNSSDAGGISLYDGDTLTRIYNAGHLWKFFESSTGDIFIYSDYSGGGVLWWNGTSFVNLNVGLQGGVWFESSKGDIFFGSASGGSPIYYWNGTSLVNVYNENNFSYFAEDGYGNVLASGSNAGAGIIWWNEDSKLFEKVFTDGQNWRYWTKTKSGDLFVSSSDANTGILKWEMDTNTFTQVYGSSNSWIYPFESSGGNLFVSGSVANTGILRWNGATFVQALDGSYGSGFQYWSEDHAGNVLVSNNTDNRGILFWNGTIFMSVYTARRGWGNAQEDDFGNLFLSSALSDSVGILKWDGNAISLAYGVGYNWRYWIKDETGNISVSNNHLLGELTYDKDLKRFVISNPDYTGKPFGGKYTMFSDTNTVCRLYQGEKSEIVPIVVTGAITENGDYAFARSADGAKILYV